ncbi:MAG: hypothetical protein ABFS56_11885 [Pseudomonadota bacterium]
MLKILAAYLGILMQFFVSNNLLADNLMPGDPSFETGMSVWYVHSGAKTGYWDNDYYPYRVQHPVSGQLTSDEAFHGVNSLFVTSPQYSDTFLIGSGIKIEKGQYWLGFSVKCTTKAKKIVFRMDVAESRDKKGIKSGVVKKRWRRIKGNKWHRLTYQFELKKSNRYFPIFEFPRGSHCWIDALSLSDSFQSAQSFQMPNKVLASWQHERQPQTWMPGLYLLENEERTFEVPLSLHLGQFSWKYRQVTVKIFAEHPEGWKKEIKVLKNLNLTKGSIIPIRIVFPLNSMGIWKITLEVNDSTTGRSLDVTNTETIVAGIVPHRGKPDVFFGVHHKVTSLTEKIGFGSIRDQRLLKWHIINPEKEIWHWPHEQEMNEIKAFVDRGGAYLVSLPGGHPEKKPNDEKRGYWGKKRYGDIPLWAASDKNTRGGQGGNFAREIKKEAFLSYVDTIAKKYDFIDYELFNEANRYMSYSEYVPLLKTAYQIIHKINPNSKVVAFASPPYRAYLRKGQPYYWFNEAFELGALNYADVVSFHCYDRTLHKKEVPETGYGMGQDKWAIGLQKLAEKHKYKGEFWCTEKGIRSPTWLSQHQVDSYIKSHRARSPLTQARWLVRSQIILRAAGVKRFFLFNKVWSNNWHDRYLPRADISHTLFEVNGMPKPALVAQRELIRRLSFKTHVVGGVNDYFRYEVFGNESSHVMILWRFGQSEPEELRGLKYKVPCQRDFSSIKATSMFGESIDLCSEEQFLTVSPSPIYILFSGKAEQTKIKSFISQMIQR